MADTPASYIERTAAVLFELAEARTSVGVTELARRLDIGTTTVHRILRGLTESGLVTWLPRERVYRLGPGAWRLGFGALESLPLRRLARPVLFELRDLTGETAALWLSTSRWLVPVDQVISLQQPRRNVRMGYSRLLHTCVAGEALLSVQSPEFLAEYLRRIEGRPGMDPAQVRDEIAAAHERGFSMSFEHTPKTNSLGFGVLDLPGGTHGAITISGPSERWTREAMLRTAEECAAAVYELGQRLRQDDE